VLRDSPLQPCGTNVTASIGKALESTAKRSRAAALCSIRVERGAISAPITAIAANVPLGRFWQGSGRMQYESSRIWLRRHAVDLECAGNKILNTLIYR
jgi:hypothetical protein